MRVHRSAVVALAHEAAARPREKGDASVRKQSGADVLWSRQHRLALIERLGPQPRVRPEAGPFRPCALVRKAGLASAGAGAA